MNEYIVKYSYEILEEGNMLVKASNAETARDMVTEILIDEFGDNVLNIRTTSIEERTV